MAKVFIISGRTGAGKTTIAKKLAAELPAFRFSHDEFLRTVFGPNIAEKDFSVCCKRANDMIWQQVDELLRLDVSIILEGWGGRLLRDEVKSELLKIGMEYHFLFVTCSTEVRLNRVLKRNNKQGTEGFIIDAEAFGKLDDIREEFDSDEDCVMIDNSNDGQFPDLSFIHTLR